MIESHVICGQEILNAMGSIPSDVVQLVLEHHEDLEGLGYPLSKPKLEQHPMSRILQCANAFIEHALACPSGPGKPALVALEHIKRVYGARIDPKCILVLESLFAPNTALGVGLVKSQ